MKYFTLFALFLTGTFTTFAQTTVTSLSALQTAINNAVPGAVIILADGAYTAGAAIIIDKQGTASQPITIRAQRIGGAGIAGTAGFSLVSPATHIIIQGFRFTHSASHATMAAGTSFCRWTRCLFQTPGTGEDLLINGNDHEVDYNTFQHKNVLGRFIAVRGTGSQIAQRIHIHHNYFLDQQPQKGNGAETLQFGLSGYSLSNSNSIVEYNLFEQCEGENELISVKASQLTIRCNTIRDCPAQFTLRHGNRSTIYGNYFINTPGLRIFGDDHTIFSNHFENCNPAIFVGNGDGEVADGAQLTAHDRPDRVLIAFNTLVNNTANIIQSGRTNGLGATDITIADNIIQGGGPAATIAGPYTGGVWSDNILFNTNGAGSIPSGGYTTVNPLLARDAAGTFHLQSGSPAINSATGSYPSVTADMDGQPRTAPLDKGADEVSPTPVTAHILSPAEVGCNGNPIQK
jgi:poly(beta-D-mannuronate) lyase